MRFIHELRYHARLIVAGLAVIAFVVGCGMGNSNENNPAGSQASDRVSLTFDCIPNGVDSYTLDIVNDNNEIVSTAGIVVAFYDFNGTQMGQEEAYGLVIDSRTTYAYHGYYARFELGGIPASCKVLDWNSQ